MCCLLVSNTNGPKTPLGTSTHHRRAGILVFSPDLRIRDLLETDAGFVWADVAGVRVYSCYFFPNDPFKIFETQILHLEESLGEADGRSLTASDFNSKSPEWGEARLDRRGILVSEMVARNDLIGFNRGSIQERSHPVNLGRGDKARSPSWNTRRLSKNKLQKHLDETRLIDELGRAKSAGSLEDTVQRAWREVVAACDHSMPRRGQARPRGPVQAVQALPRCADCGGPFNRGAKEAIRKDTSRRLVEKWHTRWHAFRSGRWTHRLIPELATWLDRKHGQVGFYLAQVLSGHGCFNAYLKRFKKRDEETRRYCDFPVKNAEHTVFFCARSDTTHPREAVGQAVVAHLTPEKMVFSCSGLNKYACLLSHLSSW